MKRILLCIGFLLALGSSSYAGFHFGLGRAAAKKSKDLIDCAQNPNDTSCKKSKTSDSGSTDPCNNGAGNGAEIVSGPSGPSGADGDQSFRSLSVDRSSADIVFVGTEKNGILKTTDGGTTWQRLRYGFWHNSDGYPENWDMTLHPQGSSVAVFASFVGSPLPMNSPRSSAGVYKSLDGGVTWQRSNCGISNQYATSVLFDPNDPSVLILGIGGGLPSDSEYAGQYQDGGLYRSTDTGATWQLLSLPALYNKNAYWHLRARGAAPTDFYTFAFNFNDLSENLGFLKSTDGGVTWTQFASPLRNLRIKSFDISTDGQTIYANEGDSFQVRKSTDAGASWTTSASPVNGPIKVSPINADLVIFTSVGSLYRSTDGMQTQTKAITDSGINFNDIEFAPSNPDIVYAITDGYHFYKSTDAGANWTLVMNLRSGVLNVQP